MPTPMKKQIMTDSAKRSRAGGLAEVNFSVLVPTTKIESVAKALEGVASLMPLFDASQMEGRGKKLPAAWALKFKNKGHEIKVVTSEGEKVLSGENSIDTSLGSPLPDTANTALAPNGSKKKRFNKFGEEIVSVKDIFPDKHPGLVLKGFRLRDDMTQQQLADLLEIGQSRVSDLESGARAISKSMAERLGKVFDISYKAFL